MLFNKYVLQAEETGGEGETTTPPILTEERVSELVSKSVKDSLESIVRESQQNNTDNTNVKDDNKGDGWDDILNPRINKATALANLKADIADDRSEFYTSDEWLEEIDDLLPGESIEDIRKVKKEVRKILEQTFADQVKKGRPTSRKDLLKFAIGEYITGNKSTYIDGISKRNTTKKQLELEKARKAVDITAGNISNFTPEQIHTMSEEKVRETFGNVLF